MAKETYPVDDAWEQQKHGKIIERRKIMPLGDFNPFPKSQQTRGKADRETPTKKKAADAKAREEGIRAMTKLGVLYCFICKKPIRKGQRFESHHVFGRAKSNEQRPTHPECHHQGGHDTAEGQKALRAGREELKAQTGR